MTVSFGGLAEAADGAILQVCSHPLEDADVSSGSDSIESDVDGGVE